MGKKNIVHPPRRRGAAVKKGRIFAQKFRQSTGRTVDADILTAWSRKQFTMMEACVRSPGERLTHLRSLVGLTLEQASKISEISRSELCRIENGERKLTEVHITRLAKLFRMPVNQLQEILAYQVAEQTLYRTPPEKPQTEKTETGKNQSGQLTLPVLTVAALQAGHMKGSYARRLLTVPDPGTLSAQAYAVELGASADSWLPPHTLVIADPDKMVRTGELVLNTATYEPLIVRLERGADMSLSGVSSTQRVSFAATVTLRQFHKIAALLPAPEFVSFGQVPEAV